MPALRFDRNFDVVVVGGGIHGCFTALHLGLQGLDVVVLEQDQVGQHASGVNAGSIHHIPRIHFELPLGERALAIWHDIGSVLADNCGFRNAGYLKVIMDEEELAGAEASISRVRRLTAIPESLLDRSALFALEPLLSSKAIAGVFAPTCGYANPAQTMQALRRRLEATGVTIVEGAHVNDIHRDKRKWVCMSSRGRWTAPRLVNCAGAWGAEIATCLGEPIEMRAVALMMTVTGRTAPIMNSVIGLYGRRLSMKQLDNGTILIGGGYQGEVFPGGRKAGVNRETLRYNLALAQKVLPALTSVAAMRMWAGIEGMTPDHAAYIGPSLVHEDLWHCFGFSAHGFYLGPVVGELLASAIVTGIRPQLLAPFALGRPVSTGTASSSH